MDDLITREAVLALPIYNEKNLYGNIIREYVDIEDVKQLPPIQPKRGLWIDDGSELGCQCSQCGKTLDEYINCGTEYITLTEIPKFCPNCGADMKGEQDG